MTKTQSRNKRRKYCKRWHKANNLANNIEDYNPQYAALPKSPKTNNIEDYNPQYPPLTKSPKTNNIEEYNPQYPALTNSARYRTWIKWNEKVKKMKVVDRGKVPGTMFIRQDTLRSAKELEQTRIAQEKRSAFNLSYVDEPGYGLQKKSIEAKKG